MPFTPVLRSAFIPDAIVEVDHSVAIEEGEGESLDSLALDAASTFQDPETQLKSLSAPAPFLLPSLISSRPLRC